MKKLSLSILSLALMGFAGTFASCSSDPEYDATETVNVSDGDFEFNEYGVWKQNDANNNPFRIDDYEFAHVKDEYGIIYGFTPSNTTKDTDLTGYQGNTPIFPYESAAGAGINGDDSPYLVAYWGEYVDNNVTDFRERTCAIWEEDGETFEPQSVMVCCNTYLKEAVLNGTVFSKKFDKEDYVKLIAHGVHVDGTVTEATFFLVNNGPVVIDTWTKFDLSSLGSCEGLYFTMESNDTSNIGGVDYLNIPTYFCMDKLVVKD